MPHTYNVVLLILSLLSLMISGCSVTPDEKKIITKQSPQQRATQLKQLTRWDVQGKIAFISPRERHSATLNWQVDELINSQTLNLTTYLGINVLQLRSINNTHTVNFDGEEYKTRDLSALIYALTGFTLPTHVLTYWLKGLPYKKSDKLTYMKSTGLPERLSSTYDAAKWEVTYASYQQIRQYNLATEFSIKKDDLLIKIKIKQWGIN